MLLKELMGEFLVENSSPLPQFLPLDASNDDVKRFSEWEVVESPNRLIKDYSLLDRNAVKVFVAGLLQFEDTVGHHAKIVVENIDVRVEVYTHDVNDITELDTEYAQYADLLFADVG